MKAYAYVRVSGQGQLDGDGPERQSAAIRAFAEKNGITIEKEFVEAYTGKELDRPVLQQIIALILENGVRTIVIEKMDRLARDVVTQELLIRDFQRNGITLVSSCPGEEDMCSKDPGRVMVRQILGAVAGYERAMVVFRTKAARDRIRARGERCEGVRPYGEHPDYPAEKKTVQTIRDLRKGGYTYEKIADFLNAEGIKPRTGQKWFKMTICRILRRSE